MIALKVKLNSEHLCTAGAEDLAVLNAMICAGGRLGRETKHHRDMEPHYDLRVGGLTGREDKNSDEHLVWCNQQLKVGDIVEVEIIASGKVDKPESKNEKKYDPEKERDLKVKVFEEIKESYLQLKEELGMEEDV